MSYLAKPLSRDRIVKCSLSVPYQEISLKVLVSLPTTYPSTTPPQLQLLSKYIGSFGADSSLFGSILRTYISVSGVEWSSDTVCVFDGLQNVIDRCTAWYEEKLSTEKAGELVRDDIKGEQIVRQESSASARAAEEDQISGVIDPLPAAMPAGVNLYVAEPIIDRKSAFVGRACRVHHPSEVTSCFVLYS